MTNSVTTRTAGKRDRLVESAIALFHEQGVQRTTLAEVAERAEVPLGNVYYYFKTKDELLGAVLDGYLEQAAALIASLERNRTPKARLKALVRNWVDMRDAVVRHGCPMGTLCAELDKSEGGLDRQAAEVMARIIDWSEDQFRQLVEPSSRTQPDLRQHRICVPRVRSADLVSVRAGRAARILVLPDHSPRRGS